MIKLIADPFCQATDATDGHPWQVNRGGEWDRRVRFPDVKRAAPICLSLFDLNCTNDHLMPLPSLYCMVGVSGYIPYRHNYFLSSGVGIQRVMNKASIFEAHFCRHDMACLANHDVNDFDGLHMRPSSACQKAVVRVRIVCKRWAPQWRASLVLTNIHNRDFFFRCYAREVRHRFT
jgi:hypothetical protein